VETGQKTLIKSLGTVLFSGRDCWWNGALALFH